MPVHALCLLVLLAGPPASPLASGVDLYERGLYEKSRAALTQVLDSSAPEADQNRARLYLAAGYFASGDHRAALYALEDLARKAPAQTVDATVFPPDFLRLWEQAKSEVGAERAPPVTAPPPPAPAPAPETTHPPAPAAPPEAVAPAPEPPSATTATHHWQWRLLALVPVAAAIGAGAWGGVRLADGQSAYDRLVGPSPPALLADGQALADRGRAAHRDAVVGFALASVAVVAAVALLIALWHL